MKKIVRFVLEYKAALALALLLVIVGITTENLIAMLAIALAIIKAV